VPFTGIAPIARMFLNKLSGEGLFDERPRALTSPGRFVLVREKARDSNR